MNNFLELLENDIIQVLNLLFKLSIFSKDGVDLLGKKDPYFNLSSEF